MNNWIIAGIAGIVLVITGVTAIVAVATANWGFGAGVAAIMAGAWLFLLAYRQAGAR